MPKTRFGLRAVLAGLGLATVLTACSAGGGDSKGESSLFVTFCSLGCNNGSDFSQISCTVVNTFVNQEISVSFNAPIRPSSVNAQTFQVTQVPGGAVPFGTRTVDPNNPRRVVFRPTIIFIDGVPQFSMDPNGTYEVFIPGASQGDVGPYITSTDGRANETRLRCTIRPDQGTTDPVPGCPTVEVRVDQVDLGTGQILPGQPADGLSNASLDTKIVMEFGDIMNPATLGSGNAAAFITISVDNDGNLSDDSDRVPLTGSYLVELDLDNLVTVFTFTPAQPLPPSGSGAQRRIVVDIPSEVQDLVGNGVCTPGIVSFATVPFDFDSLTVEENFITQERFDQQRSGARWDNDVIGGFPGSTRSLGGGSGRHGDILVRAGEVLVLNTDNQVFPLSGQPRSLLDNFDYTTPGQGIGYDPADQTTWPTLTVTDGIFEFESLIVRTGGVLRFEGDNHARVLVRGELIINGTLDAAGETPISHRSSDVYAPPGGAGGPGGGNGGQGATRFDHGMGDMTDNPNLTCVGVGDLAFDIDGDGMVLPPEGPMIDGEDGEPIAKGTVAALLNTRGRGGIHWPNTFATEAGTTSPNFGDFEFIDATNLCRIAQVGGPGSGAGNNNFGEAGMPMPIEPVGLQGGLNAPPPTTQGANSGLDDAARTLDPNQGAAPYGLLRGGAGGGGGGLHPFGTQSSGDPIFNPDCTNTFVSLIQYYDHSGGSGGGGGGALSLTSGYRVEINGLVDASGGDGESSIDPDATIMDCSCTGGCGQFLAPGGAGSGGGIRIQARNVLIAPIAGRISVAGGAGGLGVTGSKGGDGGYGLLRIEDMPDDPGDKIDCVSVLSTILPDFSGAVMCSDQDVLTTADWTDARFRPESFSGVTSCWLRPVGAPGDPEFYELVFEEDVDPSDPDMVGWNMDVGYQASGGGLEFWPYRGVPNDPGFPLPGMSFEDTLGNLINHDQPTGMGSYIAVRFQGGRVKANTSGAVSGNVETFCQLVTTGISADVVEGSYTGWVPHPADLNAFPIRPNMFRFAVIYDTSMLIADPFNLNLRGVTNLRVNVKPD